ncbi:predicted protein [Naegleria gruberi]|uniref:Predicted protein n=1 Tax=Naegleria gruberi TaxID=5762 RepID=D2UY74_NAEGR|nr:uncharacterized protein NAEGRDRAFT_61370 [Naegleria gruberi]EFC50746.1 predicted protein [Naegleria gruberi]|eukprot:XP_002683490.1 predicted protein [Naegleria gruberi strain NEG-M]
MPKDSEHVISDDERSPNILNIDDEEENKSSIELNSISEEDKTSLETFRKWTSSRSVTNPELYSSLIRYITGRSPHLFEKHCEFVEKIKYLFQNHKPSTSVLEEQNEESEAEEHGRKWNKERWIVSLNKELKLFDPNNPKRHHPQAFHINSKYMTKANVRDRYRRFFAKYPALFYIYKYTFFSGTITMVSEILENNIELKKKAEYLPTSFKTW